SSLASVARFRLYMGYRVNRGAQVPVSKLQTFPAKVPDLTPISGYQRPTRPGDITPRIMDDWGQ
ncbi:hypothetical protein, partial [Shigella sonnei]|uniref:hypothetical protein n=1 Tax=Shigella sonnei TaxID=624 RepID=UPI001C0A779F